jgi:ACR3 family arsenite efflux pump ArsB
MQYLLFSLILLIPLALFMVHMRIVYIVVWRGEEYTWSKKSAVFSALAAAGMLFFLLLVFVGDDLLANFQEMAPLAKYGDIVGGTLKSTTNVNGWD